MPPPFTKPPLGLPFTLKKTSPQARGLVHWWPTIGGLTRGGTLYDQAGRDYHGTLSGSPTWDARETAGQAITYNGSSQYATMPTLNSPNGMTVTAWVYIVGWGSNNCPVGCFGSGSDKGYWINVTSSGDAVFYTSSSGSDQTGATWSGGLSLGQWYHMAGVYDNVTGYIYVNGVNRASGGVGGGVFSVATSNAFAIGRLGALSADYFNGYVADVRFYNRALNTGEVLALYAPQTRWDLYAPLWTNAYAAPAAATGQPMALRQSGQLTGVRTWGRGF
jgi:hypothetical protein